MEGIYFGFSTLKFMRSKIYLIDVLLDRFCGIFVNQMGELE